MIKPSTCKLALFGNPVSHSLSPRIHRLLGEQFGMSIDYRAIECGIDALPAELDAFRASGGIGVNLTVPLKAVGLSVCTEIDINARRARAVNTLRRSSERWHGFNTDGGGLLYDFDRCNIDLIGRRILIIGAGGAAAGIIGSLLERGPAEVCIVNRTIERAERLTDRHAHLGPVHAAGPDMPGQQNFDLVIQATSAGHGQALPPLRRSWLSARACAWDLNYGAAHQPFAEWCRAQGLTVHDGLGMLVGQAVLAFEIWTGNRPDPTPVMTALAG